MFTITGLLMGVGTTLVWVGALRYLGFLNKYNVSAIHE